MALKGATVTGKPVFARGPITAQVSAAIAAGQVGVMAPSGGNAGKCAPATTGSIPFGIATTSAAPAGTSQSITSLGGYPGLEPQYDTSGEVAFARRGPFYLNATGTIAPGQFVKCGTNGSVVAWVVGTDTDTTLRVGQCIDPSGGVNGSPVLIDVNIG